MECRLIVLVENCFCVVSVNIMASFGRKKDTCLKPKIQKMAARTKGVALRICETELFRVSLFGLTFRV